MEKSELAACFDHTLLQPFATEDDIRNLCAEAVEHRFLAVCVNPGFVRMAHLELNGSGVRTCAAVGFPLGANTSRIKGLEASLAVEHGADEIDMVICVGDLKHGLTALVELDVRTVVEAAAPAPVKVIIETCYLSDEEKVTACRLAEQAGAAFVKTSTGFGTHGATAADVVLLRKSVGDRMGVKAAGGIATLADALALIEAGADRLGASRSVAIINEMGA